MSRHPRVIPLKQPPQILFKLQPVVLPAVVFVVVLTGALADWRKPITTGKDFIEQVTAPPPDQHFAGCREARAAGRINIPRSDPSYRSHMDGDGDGLACEPYR